MSTSYRNPRHHQRGGGRADRATIDRVVAHARLILALDRTRRPVCKDSRLIYQALRSLAQLGDAGLVDELVHRGFLVDAPERRARYVAALLRRIDGCEFDMGTDQPHLGHLVGEAPRHRVRLSPFSICRVTVTTRLYALLTPERPADAAAADLPATDLTWFDASVFATWMGCRLPTEAEWEYACGAGRDTQWCCATPDMLARHAWYSESSRARAHAVGTLEPNRLGLHDLHGNVWEWCQDDYAGNYYAVAPRDDPVNDGAGEAGGPAVEPRHKVARGGGFHALAEMCRTRYRLHDPPGYWAGDLGFRLAADQE